MVKYLTRRDVALPRRSPDSHKGENGKVLIIGGSIDYVGAVLLAGLAAFRTGADLVVIAAPEKVAWAINTFSPDFITFKFKGNYFARRHAKKIIGLAGKYDVVLVGNGIGGRKETASFVNEIVKKISKPKVIDANALRVIKLRNTHNAILTPHQGELQDLININRLKVSRDEDLKNKIGDNVLLVKGKVDRIISRDKIAYNRTGNPGMTVGGTGDVLAGITAGLLAQLKDKFRAAASAAYINGMIGDKLYKKRGCGFVASDMINEIQNVFGMVRNGRVVRNG